MNTYEEDEQIKGSLSLYGALAIIGIAAALIALPMFQFHNAMQFVAVGLLFCGSVATIVAIVMFFFTIEMHIIHVLQIHILTF